MCAETKLADAHSLHGQLQRGRGAGYLWALREDPAVVHPLLLDCIVNDPRQDHQIEARADYYAALVLQTRPPLDQVDAYLRASGHVESWYDGPGHTLAVLGALVARGYRPAAPILRDYAWHGEELDVALAELGRASEPVMSLVELSNLIDERCPDDQSIEDQTWGDGDYEPWTSLRMMNPRVDAVLTRAQRQSETLVRERRMKEAEMDRWYAEMSVSELIAVAGGNGTYYRAIGKAVSKKVTATDFDLLVKVVSDRTNDRWSRITALAGLERLADARALPVLLSIFETDDTSMAAYTVYRIARKALFALPPEMILDLMRLWFDDGHSVMKHCAQLFLKTYGTVDDVDRARRALAAVVQEARSGEEDHYLAIAMLDILTRFPEGVPYSEVEDAFVQGQHSWTRRWAIDALVAIDRDRFALGLAVECLWDCEPRVRATTCRVVNPDVPGVRERLGELANDPLDDDVQVYARQALGT